MQRIDEIRARCAEFLEWLQDGTEFREIEKHGKAHAADVPDLLAEIDRLTAELAAAQREIDGLTDAYDLKMRVHDALNRDYVALRKRLSAE